MSGIEATFSVALVAALVVVAARVISALRSTLRSAHARREQRELVATDLAWSLIPLVLLLMLSWLVLDGHA